MYAAAAPAGSATISVCSLPRRAGVDRLADYLCEIGPSPADRPTPARLGKEQTEIVADPAGAAAAYIFSTVADPFVGQLSLFKVLSGTIKTEDHLVNATSGAEERLHGLFHLRGKEHLPTDSVVAGDIAAVAKLNGSPTGSVLCARAVPVFVDAIVGGSIPRNYIPAVERGIHEAMAAGGLHGFPVVDVRVECYDGKYHTVDSSDMAFRNAAAHGLREALTKAGTQVLEPVCRLTVNVPDGYQGDVLGLSLIHISEPT